MIFSDGAGACIVENSTDNTSGILASSVQSHCMDETYFLYLGKSYHPEGEEATRYIKMKGRKVYEYAIKNVPIAMKACIEKAGVDIHEVKKFFLHQANEKMDEGFIKALYKLYDIKDIPAAQQGELTKKIGAKGEKGIAAYIASIKSKSIFFNKEKFDKFASNPSVKVLNKDPFFLIIEDAAKAYEKTLTTADIQEATDALKVANRKFTKGIREMQPNKKFYPNANSTMRMTYGQVLPYSPKDAVSYDYVTSLEGMFQKEDPSNPEFHVDPKITETWKKKDWGQYADKERGFVVCNFLSNNDITGGNSGSPVINADGHLIGTAFDGNWEAMSGNIFFEDKVQRTISCDIRYILWLVDRVYGAQNIIDELTLVK